MKVGPTTFDVVSVFEGRVVVPTEIVVGLVIEERVVDVVDVARSEIIGNN